MNKKFLMMIVVIMPLLLIIGTSYGDTQLNNSNNSDEDTTVYSCSVQEGDTIPEYDADTQKPYRVIKTEYTDQLISGVSVDQIYDDALQNGNTYIELFDYNSNIYKECTVYNGEQIVAQYYDYSVAIYSNALNTKDNVLTRKYPGIQINDMYIFSGTPRIDGFCVYYKTDKGDYLFYKKGLSDEAQYIIPLEAYIEHQLDKRNNQTYDTETGLPVVLTGTGYPSDDFLEKYNAPIIGVYVYK